MADSLPLPDSLPPLEDTICAFAPVPLERVRANGWSAEQQVRFIRALAVMTSVGAARCVHDRGRRTRFIANDFSGLNALALQFSCEPHQFYQAKGRLAAELRGFGGAEILSHRERGTMRSMVERQVQKETPPPERTSDVPLHQLRWSPSPAGRG
jgi:hypothetical protein